MSTLADLLPHLSAEEQAEVLAYFRRSAPAPSFREYAQSTVQFALDPWQHDLCNVLERFRTERGLRVAVHAPPQFGKSVLVSQRFPAWLMGCLPTERVRLACYNITHSTRFGKIIRELMQSREYAALFPSGRSALPKWCGSEEFSTAARSALKDAQPSFKALGLVTGFVGQGADCLIIDDPYASPQDAMSEAIRESVWTFWSESANVRLNADSNVMVMFHRYHEDDLAGRLFEEGGWEVYRYAALHDGAEDCYPLGRAEGDRLTDRMSFDFLREQEKNTLVWLAQFQGTPSSKEGLYFLVGKFKIVDAAPIASTKVRAWDLAGTHADGDWTVGVLMGKSEAGWCVEDVVRGQWSTDEVERRIVQTAALDGRGVHIRIPQDPGQAGKMQAAHFVRKLAGYSVVIRPISGDKAVRAFPWSTQVNAGNVSIVKGEWCKAYLNEHRMFPGGKNDDCVDASADAFTQIEHVGRITSLQRGGYHA